MNQTKRTWKTLLTTVLAIGLLAYTVQPAAAQTPGGPDGIPVPDELAWTIEELNNDEFQEVIIEFGGIAVLHLRSIDTDADLSMGSASQCYAFDGGCGCQCSSDGSECVANGCGCGSKCGCSSSRWGSDAHCKCYRCTKTTCEGGGGAYGGWGRCTHQQNTHADVK